MRRLEELDERHDLHPAGGNILRRFTVDSQTNRRWTVSAVHVICGLLAAGLLIYLFVALLKPEIFS